MSVSAKIASMSSNDDKRARQRISEEKYRQTHRDIMRQRSKDRRAINGEYYRVCEKLRRLKCRREVISHYSPLMCCMHCGETNSIVLTMDHINGKGYQHLKSIGYDNIYVWLRMKKYPDGFRVLCFNCNWIARKTNRTRYALEAISHYSKGSNVCVRCGTNDIRVLTIDHINGGGVAHRKQLGGGSHILPWLKKQQYPSGYQVLCMNCQWLKKNENKEVVGRNH